VLIHDDCLDCSLTLRIERDHPDHCQLRVLFNQPRRLLCRGQQ